MFSGANVAQLVEQLIRNEQVVSSSLIIGFNEIKGLCGSGDWCVWAIVFNSINFNFAMIGLPGRGRGRGRGRGSVGWTL